MLTMVIYMAILIGVAMVLAMTLAMSVEMVLAVALTLIMSIPMSPHTPIQTEMHEHPLCSHHTHMARLEVCDRFLYIKSAY